MSQITSFDIPPAYCAKSAQDFFRWSVARFGSVGASPNASSYFLVGRGFDMTPVAMAMYDETSAIARDFLSEEGLFDLPDSVPTDGRSVSA